MNEKKIKISIVTPDQDVFEGEAGYIGVPSVGGGLGILPGHIPILCFLDIGIVRIKNGEEITQIAVCRGFLQCVQNVANIVTEYGLITNDENKTEAIEELKKKYNMSKEITECTKKIARATAALKNLGTF